MSDSTIMLIFILGIMAPVISHFFYVVLVVLLEVYELLYSLFSFLKRMIKKKKEPEFSLPFEEKFPLSLMEKHHDLNYFDAPIQHDAFYSDYSGSDVSD